MYSTTELKASPKHLGASSPALGESSAKVAIEETKTSVSNDVTINSNPEIQSPKGVQQNKKRKGKTQKKKEKKKTHANPDEADKEYSSLLRRSTRNKNKQTDFYKKLNKGLGEDYDYFSGASDSDAQSGEDKGSGSKKKRCRKRLGFIRFDQESQYLNLFDIFESLKVNELMQSSERIYTGVPVPNEAQENKQAITTASTEELSAEVPLPIPKQPNTKAVSTYVEPPEENSFLQCNTYINCDVRFLNFKFLTSKLGYFDVVLIDPPWRIKGAQRNDTSFMFSNNKFNLEYNTLSNTEIMNLKVEDLSKKGFCFLWILNSQMHIGYECLNKWGYEVVDQITWLKTKNDKIHISHGFYFLHSSETCLVGYKCPQKEYVEFRSKVSNNIILAEVRKKSQKPHQIYNIIELMMPGSKKIELFARNNNLRVGWFSLGNQLGENYEQWKSIVTCDGCNEGIKPMSRIYKSKKQANHDLCENCFNEKKKSNGDPNMEQSYYILENQAEENVLHEYHRCNSCKIEPIWGARFKCRLCDDFDLCEVCFDKELQNPDPNNHCRTHDFDVIELPVLAAGLAAHHDYKCIVCYQKPIIGACFLCADCPNFSMCQNCYFSKGPTAKVRGHQYTHKIEIIVEPRHKSSKLVKW